MFITKLNIIILSILVYWHPNTFQVKVKVKVKANVNVKRKKP